MNKLPIEIENSIWNMYYMDHYCKIVNELNTIINVNLSLSEKIEEAKKHIRKYRFYDICNDNAKSLFMVLNKDISMIYGSKVNKIFKFIPIINQTTLHEFPKEYNYICAYLLNKYNYNKKAIKMLKTMLKC
tara:strand:- start:52 stop:444 length:393 start_codon:yes stop_codon:yes gene_type:complete